MPKSRGRRRPSSTARRPPSARPVPDAPGRPAGRQPMLTRMRADVPQSTGMRRRVEQRSAFALAYLAQLPRLVLGLVVAVLALLGLIGPHFFGHWIAGVVLLVLGLFLLWLTYLSWPGVQTNGRIVRAGATALVLGLAVWRLFA